MSKEANKEVKARKNDGETDKVGGNYGVGRADKHGQPTKKKTGENLKSVMKPDVPAINNQVEPHPQSH